MVMFIRCQIDFNEPQKFQRAPFILTKHNVNCPTLLTIKTRKMRKNLKFLLFTEKQAYTEILYKTAEGINGIIF